MKLDGTKPGVHLTYCTNIHRGETWDDTPRCCSSGICRK